MAYRCPRCGKEVSVEKANPTEMAGGPSAGLGFLLFGAFFRRFRCPEHGIIPRQEFPAGDRWRMRSVALGWMFLVLLFVAGLIALFSYWRS